MNRESYFQQQKFLANIYTDSKLRKEFFVNPIAVAEQNGLDSSIAKKLADIDQETVEKFSLGLVIKRFDAFNVIFPKTFEQLGEDNSFNLFYAWALDNPLLDTVETWFAITRWDFVAFVRYCLNNAKTLDIEEEVLGVMEPELKSVLLKLQETSDWIKQDSF